MYRTDQTRKRKVALKVSTHFYWLCICTGWLERRKRCDNCV